ncbi:DNA mismatch repair protein MutT [Clostridium sp.]|uniref:DNA mismatch repair protein MutT n=1 Tax=Clostridium sp. TaxID=1506 RepID=UPI001A403955|nr:DNA mismatch repair protein MutT [Clostridium sp.]MBK5235124.1 DNA mismatch repair protein MutT [Clostridium sp.]
MGQVVKCSIIICDDFNGVLIVARGKGKKNLQKVWSIFSKDVKGKGTAEQCITKAINKDLKCNIFDIAPFKEYVLDEENGDTSLVYTGKVKEYITAHKDIQQVKWITESELNMHDFSNGEKEILLDFFESVK